MSKYGRLGVASPVITGCDTRWSLSVAKCNNKLQKEVYVSKLFSNNEIVAYNVRHDVTNMPLDNVIIKNMHFILNSYCELSSIMTQTQKVRIPKIECLLKF